MEYGQSINRDIQSYLRKRSKIKFIRASLSIVHDHEAIVFFLLLCILSLMGVSLYFWAKCCCPCFNVERELIKQGDDSESLAEIKRGRKRRREKCEGLLNSKTTVTAIYIVSLFLEVVLIIFTIFWAIYMI